MTDVTFSSDITLKLIRASASDDGVVQAAQVSAKGENKPETVPQRLIEALMAQRHGSPFEHNSFTFFVKAPIFVFREWQRHRISSFNEWSGRYSDMLPEFYIPAVDRNLVNIGTKMKPQLVRGDLEQYLTVQEEARKSCVQAWKSYQKMLNVGVLNEIARIVLPVNTYSQMYWTVNARSLMNFLSLRVESDDSLIKSFPQKEIQMGAEQVELAFSQLMPATHRAFVKAGRVAP